MHAFRHPVLVVVLLLALVIVPSGASVGAETGAETIESATQGVYTVQLGDSLSSIAARLGVTASALMAANRISNPDLLYVGQQLIVPSASGRGVTSVGAPAASTVRYTVRRGDTLGTIAARYRTTAAAIARANGLRNANRIYVGMRLVIPVKSSGASVSPDATGSSGSSAISSGSVDAAATSKGKGTRFVASISKQHCWLYQGNTVIGDWVCSTGRRGSDTRPGNYRVQSRYIRGWGGAWNIWLPYWLGIYWAGSLENGIHGMPYSASTGVAYWPGKVGQRITYGCVMLADNNAKTLYNYAYVGMPVSVLP